MKISKHYKETLKELPKLTKKQLDDMHEIEKDAAARFTGQFQELESAMGMLRIGHFYGWKVLYIIHNKRTIKKYEEILNINLQESIESNPIDFPLCTFPHFGKNIGRVDNCTLR
jgi:hypothetical protein